MNLKQMSFCRKHILSEIHRLSRIKQHIEVFDDFRKQKGFGSILRQVTWLANISINTITMFSITCRIDGLEYIPTPFTSTS